MDKRKVLRPVLWGLAAAAALWAFTAVLLPLVLPFVLAFVLAAVTEPPALYLMKKTGLSRPLAGGLCILAAYLLLAAVLFFLGRTVFRELGSFLRELPQTVRRLAEPLERLRTALTSLTARLPDGIGTALTEQVNEFFSGGTGLARDLPAKMLAVVTRTAGRLPGFFLFLVTTVAASFFSAGVLPRLRVFLSRVLPPAWRKRVTAVWHRCRVAVGAWLRAEMKLTGVTFALVTAGLMLLGLPYPLLFGVVIALVDLLPVLGTGTVLLPWAALLFLRGQTGLGAALVVLYGICALTRTTLEPRFLGKQMGLPPLLTLAAVYIGCRTAGLWGLLLFPMGTSVLVQILRLNAREDRE